MLPFFALLLKTSLYTRESIWFLLILFATIFILSAVQAELVEMLEKQLGNVRWFDEVSTEQKTLKSLLYFRGLRVMFYGFVTYTLVLFILSLTSVETGFAVTVGPFAVMIFGLSFLSLIFSMVMYFNIPGRRPFILYFLAMVLLCGIFNDNTAIRTLPQNVKRRTLEDDFAKWVRPAINDAIRRFDKKQGDLALKDSKAIYYLPPYQDCCLPINLTDLDISALKFFKDTLVIERKRNENPKQDTINVPVIFVAAEGGGIRALTWTALVLEGLERKFPGIHRNIYGISGVSGGGVGATFYVSYLFDQLRNNREIVSNEAAFRKAVRSDFLSDLLSAFLFQDNLQKILPVGITAFDRTRRLEDAWAKSFAYHTSSNTMDKGFLNLYANDSLRVPRLFINGVLAESGQKTIVSFPTLRNDAVKNSSKPDVLADELDVIDAINKDIPIKTVASLCARFPYITSGGRISKEGNAPIGSIVDGGYKENSGLETVWQLILRLRPVFDTIQRKELGQLIRFKPIVMFIKNSPDPETLDENRKSSLLLNALSLPLKAFGKSSDRKTPTLSALTENVFNYYDEKSPGSLSCEFISVDLDRTTKRGFQLPLGWYFSESSFSYVDTLLANRFKPADTTFEKLKSYF